MELKEHYVASEVSSMYMSNEEALEDRKLFVANLGDLLSETREGIVSAELDDDDIVTITYRHGHQVKVNVAFDSYLSIIKDVIKSL